MIDIGIHIFCTALMAISLWCHNFGLSHLNKKEHNFKILATLMEGYKLKKKSSAF